MQERIRSERSQKGFSELEQTMKPVPTDGQEAALAGIGTINQLDQTGEQDRGAEKTEPEISQGRGDHEAVQAV
jgi:hypothetical protein